MFISGKGFYTSIRAIFLSLLLILFILLMLLSKSSEIGKVISETLDDRNFYDFENEQNSLLSSIYGKKVLKNKIQVPDMSD